VVADLGAEYTPAEATLNRIFDRFESNVRRIIMSSAETAATGAADQFAKAKGEIDGVITELQDQSVSDATIQRLQNLSQAFDDVVPDAPAEPEPTPEPEPEPAPEEPVEETPTG
jgi:hypothetical protein